jgi:hypothetical protein
MEEFFEDEFGIERFSKKNKVNGNSKRSCLSTFQGVKCGRTAE